METVIDAPHALLEDVRVNLRRREIGMTEHHLDGAEVCAAFEQMRGERMSERVRAERGAQTGLR
jgi:hypothetical protein